MNGFQSLTSISAQSQEKYKSRDLALAKYKEDRVLTLFNIIRDLSLKRVCHQGNRHSIVFALNGVYPGFYLIESLTAAVADKVVEFITGELKKRDDKQQFALFTAWIRQSSGLGNESAQLLQDFFHQCQKGCVVYINNFFLQSGVNPEELKEKIGEYTDPTAVMQMRVPFNAYPIGQTLKRFLELKGDEKAMDNRSRALRNCQEIFQQYTTLDDFAKGKTAMLMKLEDLYWQAKRLESIKASGDNTKLSPVIKAMNSLIQLVEEGYKLLAENQIDVSLLGKSDFNHRLDAAEEDFTREFEKFKKDHQSIDDIIDSFAVCFPKDGREAERARYRTFMKMRSREIFKNYIEVDDTLLRKVFGGKEEDKSRNGNQVIHLDLYMLIRILWHAILTPRYEWTETFEQYYPYVFHFLENHFHYILAQDEQELPNTMETKEAKEHAARLEAHSVQVIGALMESSFPPQLLRLLKFLLYHPNEHLRRYLQGKGSIVEPLFPFPIQISNQLVPYSNTYKISNYMLNSDETKNMNENEWLGCFNSQGVIQPTVRNFFSYYPHKSSKNFSHLTPTWSSRKQHTWLIF